MKTFFNNLNDYYSDIEETGKPQTIPVSFSYEEFMEHNEKVDIHLHATYENGSVTIYEFQSEIHADIANHLEREFEGWDTEGLFKIRRDGAIKDNDGYKINPDCSFKLKNRNNEGYKSNEIVQPNICYEIAVSERLDKLFDKMCVHTVLAMRRLA